MINDASNDPPPATRYRRLDGVIETELDTELILLDPASQAMFSLNAVGARIWRLLDSANDAAIVAAVVTDFDVDDATASRDVAVLLGQLAEAGLLVVGG